MTSYYVRNSTALSIIFLASETAWSNTEPEYMLSHDRINLFVINGLFIFRESTFIFGVIRSDFNFFISLFSKFP